MRISEAYVQTMFLFAVYGKKNYKSVIGWIHDKYNQVDLSVHLTPPSICWKLFFDLISNILMNNVFFSPADQPNLFPLTSIIPVPNGAEFHLHQNQSHQTFYQPGDIITGE